MRNGSDYRCLLINYTWLVPTPWTADPWSWAVSAEQDGFCTDRRADSCARWKTSGQQHQAGSCSCPKWSTLRSWNNDSISTIFRNAGSSLLCILLPVHQASRIEDLQNHLPDGSVIRCHFQPHLQVNIPFLIFLSQDPRVVWKSSKSL